MTLEDINVEIDNLHGPFRVQLFRKDKARAPFHQFFISDEEFNVESLDKRIKREMEDGEDERSACFWNLERQILDG